ncbi:chaplin [Streptomyces sp. NPDC059468]|uniref:chaplin n=1 Tax=Streptomyces sp. NPDC059468 TaxID=3346845 RepID=UPI00369106C3
MRQTLSKGVVVAAAATGMLSLCGSYALADSGAQGAAQGSPGVLSGNTVQAPVDVPINVCGNSVDAAAALNPAFGNSCANTHGSTSDDSTGAQSSRNGGEHSTPSTQDGGNHTTPSTQGGDSRTTPPRHADEDHRTPSPHGIGGHKSPPPYSGGEHSTPPPYGGGGHPTPTPTQSLKQISEHTTPRPNTYL